MTRLLAQARLLTSALALSLCLVAHADATAGRRAQPTGTQDTKQSAARPAASPSPTPAPPAQTSAKPAAPPAAKTDAPLPVVTELNIEGLKKLFERGDPSKAKPLLVNFWATWCDPCRAEFPDLVKVDADYKSRGLDFVVVSGDDISDIKTGVPKFLQEMNAQMPAYLLNVLDMSEAINAVDTTWGGEMPATYLFDKSGQVAFKHFGRIDPKELRAALDKVLTQK
jgi:thiol-disulfide isomerase/thioredoxin